MPFFCRIFNMPDFTSTCRILLQHAVFFPLQFQHAGFFFNMPDSAAPFFNMPFLYLQHAVFFCSNFNMPESAAPFFNMPFFIPSTCRFFLQQFQHAGFRNSIFNMPFFIPSTCRFLSVADSTCRIFFQHAGFRNSIFQHAVFITSTCRFFLQQFQHARFRNSIFQHAFFHSFIMPFFSAAISTCRIQELHLSTCLFSFLEHAVFFCSNFNMPDSGTPFFNMPFFIPSTCRLLSVAVSTCWFFFNMPDSVSSTLFQHAVFIHSTCLFFLEQFQHAGFRNTCILQIQHVQHIKNQYSMYPRAFHK